MLNMQKELAEAYEQASRAWLDRVKSEAELWSDLASKLSATRSVPEAMAAYQASVTKRLQMAADDGRRMAEDCQALMQKFTQSLTSGLSGGRPGGST
jgi:hypothetical protein